MTVRTALLSAVIIPVTLAAPAAASIAYGVTDSGALLRFDPYSNDTPVLFGHGWGSQVYGFAIDNHNVGWGIDSFGHVHQYDMQTGDSTLVGALPSQNGWYKDMAWDPAHNRVLAMHFGTAPQLVDIYELNTNGPFGWTNLGAIIGLAGLAHVTGMAVAPDGTITLGDQGNGKVWDLTPAPDGLHAVARPHTANMFSLHGIEYDPATGDLLGVDPVARILPDGSSQQMRGVPYPLFDLAFFPVPAPATATAVLAVVSLVARRRRAT